MCMCVCVCPVSMQAHLAHQKDLPQREGRQKKGRREGEVGHEGKKEEEMGGKSCDDGGGGGGWGGGKEEGLVWK